MDNIHIPVQKRIESITIKGFRSIANLESLKLPQLAVLIGPNGSGKSNFILFSQMLRAIASDMLQEFIAFHGGGDDQLFMGAKRTPYVEAQIQIKAEAGQSYGYRFNLMHTPAHDTLIFSDEAYKQPSQVAWQKLKPIGNDPAILYLNVGVEDEDFNHDVSEILNLMRQLSVYQFNDTSNSSPIKLAQDINDNIILKSDGSNLAPVLLNLQQKDSARYKLIIRQISRILPTFGDFILQPAYGKVELRWRGKYGDKSFGAHLTSDGSLRMFCLITLLNLPRKMLPDVLFLDEPELGLHPHALTLVSAMIRRLSAHHQVIVATQSPYLVDCFELENIIVADLKDGATLLSTVSREQYHQWLDDECRASDLWVSNIIGGSP